MRNWMSWMIAIAVALTSASGCEAQKAEISLQAGREPEEQGIRLVSDELRTDKSESAGKPAWVSRHKNVPADEWARSFALVIADERFKNGKMPVVDVEVVYQHGADTGVEVKADTQNGSEVVARGWGKSPNWQTLKFQINNAYFGARKHGNGAKSLSTDGYDLRINAWAGDFFLHSVKISGEDRSAVNDWSRFLNVDGVESASKFIVAPGGSDAMKFKIRNRATKIADASVQFEVRNGDGKVMSTRTDAVKLKADAVTDVPFKFDSKELETGEYSVRAAVDVKDGDQKKRALTYEQVEVIAGPEDIFIVFDKEPIMRGMDFDRNMTRPVEIEVNGAKRWIWESTHGSGRGSDAWWNSMLMTITDPRFVKSGRPAVDIKLNYRNPANAPVNLSADTAEGTRIIAHGWGANPNWQTMWTQLDNGKFAQTKYSPNPKDMLTDGVDLRYNSCNGQAQLRSVFIRGYDLDKNPDYRRLLRYDGIDAGRKIYLFTPGEKTDLKIKLRNLARVALPANYSVTLRDDRGKELWKREEKSNIAASSNGGLPVAFDTKGLKQGVYSIALSLGRTAAGKYEELISPVANVMVADQSAIGKAKDGEFLYGLDIINGQHLDEHYMWADFMGADILRGIDAAYDSENYKRGLARIAPYNLKTQAFFQPQWDADEATRDRKNAEEAARAEKFAREFGAQTYYYELGNEPDLTYFYPGPMEAYVKGMEQIARAIKKADPDSVVMNGGLSFAGEEGDRRSREFIKLFKKDSIDAIAYHAHGPGSGSERAMVEKVRAEAKKWGKGDMTLIQTESGVAASTPAQLRMQARTVIQKMTYAQSVGIPMFQWFRLFIDGGDGGYTNIINPREPRPAVLSYRTMTKLLKGLKYTRTLDVSIQEAEAYLFSDNRGTDRRALVMWTNGQGGATRTLNLGAAAKDVKLIDLFGNPLPIVNNSIVTVPLDNDPIFLTWRGSDVKSVTNVPSMLEASALTFVSPGADTLKVTVKNPTAAVLQAKLLLQAGSATGITANSVEQMTVSVPANGTKQIEIPITVSGKSNSLPWPKQWTVFTGLPAEKLTGDMVREIPSQLAISGQNIKAQTAVLGDDLTVDLAKLGGGFGEKKEAVVMAEIFSPTEQTVRFGASADWWMEWFVNGQRVYSTIPQGNQGGYSVLDHMFPVNLKAGRNVIAVRVLSGSQGWKVVMGGPDEIAQARGSDTGEHNVSIELRQGEAMLARQRLNVRVRKTIASLDNTATTFASWNNLQPEGELAEEVVNDWAKQPDSSRWWQGLRDLSGRVWLRADAQKLSVIVGVRDDVNRPASNASAIESSDAVRLAIASMDGKTIQLGAASGGNAAYLMERSADGKNTWKAATGVMVKTERAEQSGMTWYRFDINRAQLPAQSGALAVAVRINDDDFGGLKQFTQTTGANLDAAKPDINRWWQVVLK